jgi:hypothetical protein
MKRNYGVFSRFTALALLVSVSFMSCPTPLIPPTPEPKSPPIVITPGEGTPKYVYLDSDGNAIETETGNSGKTGYYVENNKNAEGVGIFSDDTGIEDRVTFIYEELVITMFFNKNSNFPHRMAITYDGDDFSAILSPYNEDEQTYNIAFWQNNTYDIATGLVLNKQIFSLYEDDPELTDSQNRRMANLVIAMGLWASLYASFEGKSNTSAARGLFTKPIFSVRNLFVCVAIVAAAVAVVVASPAAVVSAAAATVIGLAAFGISVASIAIVNALDKEKESTHIPTPSDPPSPPPPPIVSVTLVDDGGKKVRYGEALMDGGPHEKFSHEVFHIGPEGDLLIDFWAPAGNFTDFNAILNKDYVYSDEPQVPFSAPPKYLNLGLFAAPEVTVEKKEKQTLRIRIKRSEYINSNGDGNVNFGFVIPAVNKPLEVNGYKDGFEFRTVIEKTARTRTDMVVIYFCVDKDCPNAVLPEDDDEP